eukprot:1186062-Prorocentrum_minimum.AAC.9
MAGQTSPGSDEGHDGPSGVGQTDDPNAMSLYLQSSSGKVPQFVTKLLIEAKTRWLKCAEVGDLLLNYKSYSFQLSNVPPNKPPGTLTRPPFWFLTVV